MKKNGSNGAKRVGPIHDKRGFIRYSAYNFVQKDPAIDELRTILQDQNGGKLDGSLFRKVRDNGGPTEACLRGWFMGKTRRPFSDSLEAAGRAMGVKRKWVRHND